MRATRSIRRRSHAHNVIPGRAKREPGIHTHREQLNDDREWALCPALRSGIMDPGLALRAPRDDNCECGASPYRTRLALLQLFSEAHTPRDRRKQSTGVEEPSARKRCSCTPLHWKPHFSSTLREAGLVTRAPA